MFGENSFCSIFVLSTNYADIGTIEYANEEVTNLFGHSAKSLIGKDINVVIP